MLAEAKKLGQSDVFHQARRTSATLHACATQPRGVNGGSASKISLIVPIHGFIQVRDEPGRGSRVPRCAVGMQLSQASTNGPISQAQTVP